MVQYLRLVGLALLLSVGVGGVGKASSRSVEVVNEVTELEFSYLDEIATGPLPTDFMVDGWCSNYLSKAKTLSGQNINKTGWKVLSEQSVGPYLFISFSGELLSYGAQCFFKQGNIAIFKSSVLVGVIYSNSKDDDRIGRLSINEAGIIELSDASWAPWVDIKILKDQVKIERRAGVQSFCNGSTIVPNVVGLSIVDARKSLIEFGWEPVIQIGEVSFSFVDQMRESGIVETVDCIGTGRGFCSHEYQNPNGLLSLESSEQRISESYGQVVVYYGVSCN